MRRERIEVGDVVTVRFSSGHRFEGIVYSMPAATGDSWIIREIMYAVTSGDPPLQPRLHYVQQFEEIILYDP